jgi:UrcA family protein
MFKPIAIALLLASAPSLAGTPAAPTARVQVADLDLATPAGLNQFDRRLAAAVRALCPDPNVLSLTERRDRLACTQAAMRSAEQGRERVLAGLAAGPLLIAGRTR